MAGIDAGDVGAAVSVQVGDGASGGAHAPFVEIGTGPALGGAIVGIQIDGVRLTSETGDNLVVAVAVEIGGLDSVSVKQRIVDYVARPRGVFHGVDSSLVAVPGFDGGEEAGCAEMSDSDVTRPGLGPGRRIAFGDFGALEGPGFGRAELVNAEEAGSQDAVGIGYEDAVHDAGVFGTDYVPLPFSRAVINERGLIAVVGSGSSGYQRAAFTLTDCHRRKDRQHAGGGWWGGGQFRSQSRA